MNYYPHHIGDFDRATRHLTRVERSVYRDLLDVYYDTEEQLIQDEKVLCRKILAHSPDEQEAVRNVLNEFFHLTPNGWYNDRCEAEIESYRKSTTQKSIAGKASAAARATKREQAINGITTAVEQTLNGTPTNQEPITKNQKPKSSVARGSRITEGWMPSQEDATFCKTERPDLRPSEVAKRFYDHWIAQPGEKGRKLDWSATWRNWVRNERPGKLTVADQEKPKWD